METCTNIMLRKIIKSAEKISQEIIDHHAVLRDTENRNQQKSKKINKIEVRYSQTQ